MLFCDVKPLLHHNLLAVNDVKAFGESAYSLIGRSTSRRMAHEASVYGVDTCRGASFGFVGHDTADACGILVGNIVNLILAALRG